MPWRKTIIKHYLKYVDKIFAVSLELKKALEQNGIKHIAVIHNGIDINKWQTISEQIEKFKNDYQLQNKKIIFWGGRLNTLKGGGLLLNALEFDLALQAHIYDQHIFHTINDLFYLKF